MATAVALDSARIDELADEIAELEAHITAAGYRQLLAIRELDRLEGWAVQGATSCAAWLTWRILMVLKQEGDTWVQVANYVDTE